MTNLDALRSFPAEMMADFLTDQRLMPVLATMKALDQPTEMIEAERSKVRAMFLNWLLEECRV